MNRVLPPRRLSTVSASVRIAIESFKLNYSDGKLNKKDSKPELKTTREE